ncbi:FAD-dependent oxidoreductase [Pseudonocardia sp. MH-G8]|uniref:FAD-dependent oxidoreductase n=1 Tax=Pseudonocardia sp. MH-G8 TaxID=1854588 RepID=UPI00130420C8|nr:FAD-dependent oxidoreductase [Pseudonocardia sp. MH-G8]
MPCPPTLPASAPRSATAVADVSTDVVVVGAGAPGAAVAWHLARLGAKVLLVERRAAGDVWRSAGPARWNDVSVPPALADEAFGWWREVERDTGATLLHAEAGAWWVRPRHAVAALTAAATGWGAVLRHCDPVRSIELRAGRAVVHTPTAALHAHRVVLAGAGLQSLSPVAAGHAGPVLAGPRAGAFAVPAQGRSIATAALPT